MLNILMILSFLLGAIAHLTAKILYICRGDSPVLADIIGALGFSLYSLIHGVRFKGTKQTLVLLAVSLALGCATLLFFANYLKLIFISRNMMIGGLTIPLMFWLFALLYNSVLLAEMILTSAGLMYQTGRLIKSMLASFIAGAYMLTVGPAMQRCGIFGFKAGGNFFNTAPIQYLLWLLLFFAIIVLASPFKAATVSPQSGEKTKTVKWLESFPLVFYIWLIIMALLTGLIFQMRGMFVVILFGMVSYVFLALRPSFESDGKGPSSK